MRIQAEPRAAVERPDASLAGTRRVVLGGLAPASPDGFDLKRVEGETLVLEADVFVDGHDRVAGELRVTPPAGPVGRVPLQALVNDRFVAETQPFDALGRWRIEVAGWVDEIGTWQAGVTKKIDAGLDVAVDRDIGAALLRAVAARAEGDDAATLRSAASALAGWTADGVPPASLEPSLAATANRWPDPHRVSVHPGVTVMVERALAGCSAWYELFPRSWGPDPGGHGTLAEVHDALRYVADLGFDVLYLPPVHPIGITHRKGPNNDPAGAPGAVGSPWAIGSEAGGHDAVHPELGTVADVTALAEAARAHGLELALDIALQCSPDHPWVSEHPDWFRHRPDGSIACAENPPKVYQDIYPLDFDCDDWRGLWAACAEVVLGWAAAGVRVFRVDNPHTKPFRFWDWLIEQVRRRYSDTVFLSEAFTRPKVMARLAAGGFSQSYTYFTWREEAGELREYLSELTSPPLVDLMRPNFWPNTPDILPEHLQTGGRAAFVIRAVLASMLSANWGVYGPAFELAEARAVRPGSEEYLDSEKYQIRHWDRSDPASLAPLLRRLNTIRRAHPALRQDRTLVFHDVEGEGLLCWSKRLGDDTVLCVVSLDPHAERVGLARLDLDALGWAGQIPLEITDALDGATYRLEGPDLYLRRTPDNPAHVFVAHPGDVDAGVPGPGA